MTEHDETRMKELLQQALPRVQGEPAPRRDLWPAMQKRLEAKPTALPWFDLALAASLVALAALFPASIPVLLYYL
jgi:hypothetical protein